MQREATAIQRVLKAHKLAGVRIVGSPHSFATSALYVYRLQRADGVPVAHVGKLAPEIDEELTAIRGRKTQCRISALPLRVEVPRPDAQVVSVYGVLRDIAPRFNVADPAHLYMLAGETVQPKSASPLLFDLVNPNTPHLLIAGTTGSGKTNLLTSAVISLAHLNDARRLSIVALDPKGVDLHCLNGLPHLAGPVVRDAVDCVPVLQDVLAEMDRRKVRGVEPTHRIVVAIDEVADLMDVAGDEVEFALKRIMQVGRGLGIHVIAATQKPTAAQVGPIIKANFPVRIVGSVASTNDSTVAAGFGGVGAERLPGKGSFLVVRGGDVSSLQAYYADKTETARHCTAVGHKYNGWQKPWHFSGPVQHRKPAPTRGSEAGPPMDHLLGPPADRQWQQADRDENTDFLPYGPPDQTGQRVIRRLYEDLGSYNKVWQFIWPNRRKETCLTYIKEALGA
jgi:S-DNA-T family DNA segregation ATPase FtsK/SpoIIIE